MVTVVERLPATAASAGHVKTFAYRVCAIGGYGSTSLPLVCHLGSVGHTGRSSPAAEAAVGAFLA